ncbi:MAG: RluA family pseudouridine synthase [Bradymonadales bacterium]|nr:RluA family pseudouridine synthase [Bradymonadales bacterium]
MGSADESGWLNELFQFEVRPEEHDWRLDRILQNRLKGYSRQTVHDLIRRHNQQLDRAPLKPGRHYKAGETFEIMLVRRAGWSQERPAELVVLHEDDALLVVEKDGNTTVHGGSRRIGSLVDTLRRHGYPHIWPVHRLDRETSGLVLFAKSSAIAKALQTLWSPAGASGPLDQREDRLIAKGYLALVHGVPQPADGRIELPLGPLPSRKVRIKQGPLSAEMGGRAASTWYRTVSAFPSHALLHLWPRTGRLHQIRVHLSHIGHPIVGDKLYGVEEDLYLRFVAGRLTDEDRKRLVAPSHLLHAGYLRLLHPTSGAPLELRSRLPAFWTEILGSLSGLSAEAAAQLLDAGLDRACQPWV